MGDIDNDFGGDHAAGRVQKEGCATATATTTATGCAYRDAYGGSDHHR